MPAGEHPLITIRVAALALGCSEMTIRRRVEARQFPAVKIGSKALVPRAFVERLLADALAGATVVVEEYAAAWARAVDAPASSLIAAPEQQSASFATTPSERRHA